MALPRLGLSVMPLRIPRVVLRVGPGPTWTSGLPEDQPGWTSTRRSSTLRSTRALHHAVVGTEGWLDVDLGGRKRGRGPGLMQQDPFVQNGVFVIEDVADWTVYVDTRIE